MIQFENVTKTYAGGKVKAVDGLDMQIEEGKVFGFIGPNGAGKTTTIKLLTGILSPDSGRVMLNGIDMARDPIAAKRSFGYVPDSFDMYERLTGMDYLNFMADIYGVDAASRKRHIEKYLALFELEDAGVPADSWLFPRHEAEAGHYRRAHPRTQHLGAGRAHGGPGPAERVHAQGRDAPPC